MTATTHPPSWGPSGAKGSTGYTQPEHLLVRLSGKGWTVNGVRWTVIDPTYRQTRHAAYPPSWGPSGAKGSACHVLRVVALFHGATIAPAR